jgi:hypothetical protein
MWIFILDSSPLLPRKKELLHCEMRISWLFVNGAPFGRCISALMFLITLFWYPSIGHLVGAYLIVGWAQERSMLWLIGYYTESGMPKPWFPGILAWRVVVDIEAQCMRREFGAVVYTWALMGGRTINFNAKFPLAIFITFSFMCFSIFVGLFLPPKQPFHLWSL